MISRRILNDWNLEIVTEILGKNGNNDKTALIRHTYSIGDKTYLIIKEVRLTGEKNGFNGTSKRIPGSGIFFVNSKPSAEHSLIFFFN